MRARIRAGDREAFAALYEEYARAVYNHAYRLTGDWSTAEEVLSETFPAAWRTRHSVEPEGDSLRPWLLGIATNKARNANRGTGRRPAFLSRLLRPAVLLPAAGLALGGVLLTTLAVTGQDPAPAPSAAGTGSRAAAPHGAAVLLDPGRG